MSVAFSDPRDCIDGKFLLAFKAYSGAFREAEYVFRFDVAIDDGIVLSARDARKL